MAETLSRSQLIQKQIENLLNNAPPPVTTAERDQIMKGRKGQKDIDAGRAAIDARTKEVSDYNTELKALNTQLGGAQKEDLDRGEKSKREADSGPIKNIAAPGLAGALAGSGVTYGLNKIVGAGDKARTRAIIEIGDEIGPTKDLTHSQINRSRSVGAGAAAEKYVPTTLAGKLGNFAKRAGTYAVPVAFIKNEYDKYEEIADDEKRPWDERQSARRMANGFLGAFTGIGIEGTARFLNQKVDPGEGQAMMRINTARDYAKRMDAKDAAPPTMAPQVEAAQSRPLRAPPSQTIDAEVIPEPVQPKALPAPAPEEAATAPKTASASAPTPGSKAHLVEQAKALGITGAKSMNKGQLAEALSAVMQEHGAKRTVAPRSKPRGGTVPGVAALIGGGLAADAAYNDARADGATPMGAIGSAAEPAAVAGGTAAATTYGMGKIAQALGPMAMKALNAASPMSGPMSVSDMTDMTPHEINQGRNFIARNAPALAMGPEMNKAYDMAQTPQQAPEKISEGPRADNGFAPQIQSRLERMVQLGAPPEAIASFLNQAAAR